MFNALTEKINQAFRHLKGTAKITEDNITESLKEVRTALLGADVHFKVVRQFIDTIQQACLGQKVLESVTPGQQFIKIVHDELVKLLGDGTIDLKQVKPLKIMLVGLHGSGKTTSAAKLAKYLVKKNYKPILVACDVYRPAAIDQLQNLAQKENILFYSNRTTKDVSLIGKEGLRYGEEQGADCFIFDTAGRLQIDEVLIEEIKDLNKQIHPDESLLVADSALGQEAVNVAKHFHEAVSLTGIILTKLDGDARGGAALSMKAITNVPIKFMGMGEKTGDFEVFHPDRMSQRILGMGDVVSLVEKAQEHFDEKEAERLAKKIQKSEFDLEDFLQQMRQIKKMGSLSSMIKMIPGMSGVDLDKHNPAGQMKMTEAIILSMTLQERRKPQLINNSPSRRNRIAKGSGTQVKDVNALLKQFSQMRDMMKMMTTSKGKKMMQGMMGKLGKSAPGGFNLDALKDKLPPGFKF